MKEYVLL